MRKLIIIIGALGACLIAGCGSSSSSSSVSAANAANTSGSTGGKTIAAARGVDPSKKTITLGVIGPLTGQIAPLTAPAIAGIEAYWKGSNARGGVDGWKVNLDVQDNAFNPQTSLVAYQGMRSNIAMLGQIFQGTDFTATAADKMVMASGQDISLTALPNNILVVPPLRFEAQNIVQYWKNQGAPAGAKMAIAYFDITLGHDAAAGFKRAVSSLGFTQAAAIPYELTTTDFTSVIKQLQSSGAQYVYIAGTTGINQQILATAAQLGYNPTWGISGLAGFNASMVPHLPSSVLSKLYVTQALALPTDTGPGMTQLQADEKKYESSTPVDVNFTLGYATAWIEATLLKRAIASGSLQPQALLNTLETNMKNVTTGGLLPELSYGDTPGTRIPSRASNIYAIDPSSPSKLKPVASNVETQSAKEDNLQ